MNMPKSEFPGIFFPEIVALKIEPDLYCLIKIFRKNYVKNQTGPLLSGTFIVRIKVRKFFLTEGPFFGSDS